MRSSTFSVSIALFGVLLLLCTDAQGQGRSRSTQSAQTAVPTKANPTGTNYAILIGINTYEQPEEAKEGFQKLGNLDFCVADMQGLKDALLQCKFLTSENHVRLLVSGASPDHLPTRANILAALDDIVSNLRPGDAIFFAFSGHGVSLVEGDKNADQLCCSDAKIFSATNNEGLLSCAKVEYMLENSRASSKIVMLDACRNVLTKGVTRSLGSFSGEPLISKVRGLGEGKQFELNFEGLFRLNSCSPGQVSHEGVGEVKNGVFTHFLIKGLRGEADKEGTVGQADGKITLAELFDYTSTRTKRYVKDEFTSEQVPRMLSDSPGTSASVVIGLCEKPKEPEVVPQPRPQPQPRPNDNNRSGGSGGRGGSNLGRSGTRS